MPRLQNKPAYGLTSPTEAAWFALHVRHRQEKKLAEVLAAKGIEHYLPLIRADRVHGHRRGSVWLPLFAGYLFLRGDREDLFAADRTRRVIRIIEVPDQQRLAWELDTVRALLRSGAAVYTAPPLTHGTRVEVTAGAFRGLQGVVERLHKPTRLWVQVQMLEQAISLELDAGQVRPLEEPGVDHHRHTPRRAVS
ncbi:MAG: transcription termination/antitermination NusG family protein [Planctomycetota bacterium]